MVMQAGENAAYRHSDAVVSMLPAAEPHMRSHGLAPVRFFHVPNGIDLGEWEGEPEPLPAPAAQALAEHRRAHRFLVGYAGAHGPANALDTLLDAAALLEDAGVGIVLVGQGPEKEALRGRARTMGLRHVAFLDPVPKRAVPSLLREIDGAFIGIARRPLYRFGVSPNKLMDYMMSGRPVVCGIQEDAGNDMVRDAGCGFSVPPDDPAALAGAIRRLAALAPAEREAMGLQGRRHVEERHAYGVLARQFLEVLRG
jgi:glycosyltransferase involved in cell wall biosynthesis